MSDEPLTERERLEYLRLETAKATRDHNATMNKALREAWAKERARIRAAGPPSRERCLAMRERLRNKGIPAGYRSICKALQADGWTVTLDQVRYRLRESQP